MKKMVGNNKGFTLIELVIVIAILGVLAAVAITMFPKLASSSREGADVTRASQIKSAIATYIAESGDIDASTLATVSGVESVDGILFNLQQEITHDGEDYGPYLEPISATIVASDYYPQADPATGWDITIDSATGSVRVEVTEDAAGSVLVN